MDLIDENRMLKEALLGLRGLCVLESAWSPTYVKAVAQIDETLVKVGIDVIMLDEPPTLVGTFRISNDDEPYGPRDDARDEQAREDRHNDNHRNAVPPWGSR